MTPDCTETSAWDAEMQGNAGKANLIVAFDVPDSAEALVLADRLSHLPLWAKLGLELFTAEGPELVRAIHKRGLPVFLDLKFHDIPNTVKAAVRSASVLGVSMCTVHALGGEDMCRAAVDGRNEAAAITIQDTVASLKRPLIMAVTVLTSQGGDAAELKARVVELAIMAKNSGLDGVVCSGHEVEAVKKACGANFLCLCPGIRFAGAASDDQARVCTPAQAVAAGADFLVMGRPIIRAQDPAEAAHLALSEMA